MNNKPFDLQKALAGEPVVTARNGKAEYICNVNNARNGNHHVFKCHFIDSENRESEGLYYFNDSGEGFSNSGTVRADYVDLFMALKKEIKYLNMWRDSATGLIRCSDPALETEQAAKDHWTSTMHGYIGTYPIEIEL